MRNKPNKTACGNYDLNICKIILFCSANKKADKYIKIAKIYLKAIVARFFNSKNYLNYNFLKISNTKIPVF